MNVTIQIASKSNLAELIPLIQAYHEFEGLTLTEIELESAVGKLISDKSLGGIWMIYTDKEFVGYIAICTGFSIEFAGKDAFIDEFYIIPEFRDKGVGRRVLALIKDEARKMNIKAIHLEVARTNQYAQSLYSKANFKAREKYVIMSVDL